jgi:chromosome partitioning protein
MSYIITISNEKGGVAKTTTCLSLGASLAEQGRRVLLIDLDPQANLSLALGFEQDTDRLSSSQILIEGAQILDACSATEIENLDLIPSSATIENAEQFLPMRMDFRNTLRYAFEAADSLPYEYVIIDCPPSLGAITTNALCAAQLLIIPTQAEYFSAYALRNMMSLVRRIREENNPSLVYRILITLLDRRNRTHCNIEEQLRNTFEEGLLETVIEIDTKLRESPIVCLPITRYKPNSRGSQQYRILAQELIRYVEEANRQPA